MQLEKVNDIKKLQVKLMNGETMPDLKRLYIYDQLLIEKDPQQRLVLQALLEGYESGKIDVMLDFWDGKVKYSPSTIN